MKSVAIIGGGVAGLTAAQELLERGFEVSVYELKNLPGGKARSLKVPITEHAPTVGKKQLPAEHGFRFFPGFYRHLDETMAKIPSPVAKDVKESLVNVHQFNYTRLKGDIVPVPAGSPKNLKQLFQLLKKWTGDNNINMPFWELIKFWRKLIRFFSSCDERVQQEFEQFSMWEFLDAENSSKTYRRYFGNGSRVLVAADPLKASAKTNGMIIEQLLMSQDTNNSDRVLPGPTNPTWILPWLKLLSENPNFHMYFNADITEIQVDANNKNNNNVSGFNLQHRDANSSDGSLSKLTGCDIDKDEVEMELADLPTSAVQADYYLCTTPVDVTLGYLKDGEKWGALAEADPRLKCLEQLREHTQWMNGVIYYLKGEIDPQLESATEGHAVYVDSPFALTSIFQNQYWSASYSLSNYGDGKLNAICSVVVSNWKDTEPDDERLPFGGRGRKYKMSGRDTLYNNGDFDQGKEKLKEEVWLDLKDTLTVNGKPVLANMQRVHDYVDPALKLENSQVINSEQLLVNRKNGWQYRPYTKTALPNFFLAGDYVRTYTDLATMEAACESAKRAVNEILTHSGNTSSEPCKLHQLERIPSFALARKIDKIFYKIKRFGKPKEPYV